jgi:hypothetical protein
VSQWTLQAFTDEDVRRLWNQPSDSPVYGGYAVTENVIPSLTPHIDVPIDLTKFDYFVESEAAR